MLSYRDISTPVGRLRLVASPRGLVAILWEHDRAERVRLGPSREEDTPVLHETERQLREYFSGKRREFDLQLDARGTDFQRRVWAELAQIPFGETRSYGQLATRLGDAKASRAVGAANGRNPISIVVPCHRVIGASGRLTGFAGGLATKEFLLRLEGRSL